jgi:hypothetical protein
VAVAVVMTLVGVGVQEVIKHLLMLLHCQLPLDKHIELLLAVGERLQLLEIKEEMAPTLNLHLLLLRVEAEAGLEVQAVVALEMTAAQVAVTHTVRMW